MEYIIGGIVIIICLYLTGNFFKKKYYKEMDRLETWKMDITDRPVLEEMTKVKKLNMTGQTEELFERWRNEWDEIVTTELPNVEEYLFDAEEYIDKYRFKKAKEVQDTIAKQLASIEENIKILLAELNDLVGSEEKNRVEIIELTDVYRESKKNLLAHRHTFGKAEAMLEQQLADSFNKFKEFEDKTEEGNYLEAREIVFTIRVLLENVQNKMELIPNLIVECQSKLPTELAELKDGYREMLAQGYILEHIQFEMEIEELEAALQMLTEELHQTEIEKVQEGCNEIQNRVEALYDLFEQEVKAKQFINRHDELTRNKLFLSKDVNKHLKGELTQVCQSYQVPEKDFELQAQFEQKLSQLFKRYEVLEHNILSQGAAHTVLMEELEDIKIQIDELSENQGVFAEKLQTLRKEEMAAREKVQELSKKIAETTRLVSKSHVPGLSQEYKYLLQDAKESIENVLSKLEEKPLDIPTLQQYLEVAVLTVEKAANSINEMVETIMLAEKVIQYGNRYRSSYPSIEKGLYEAEKAFRSYDYKVALEQAATSIEEIEPGALKKIESLLYDK